MTIVFYLETNHEKPIKTINSTAQFKKGDNIELDEYMFEVLKTNYAVSEEVVLYVYVKPIGKMFI